MPKNWNYLLEDGPLVVQSSPARWVFQEPICVSAPAGIVVRGCIWLQWIFFLRLSMHLPISWWVIYKCTCPHYAECSAVFDPKWHDLHAPSPKSLLLTISFSHGTVPNNMLRSTNPFKALGTKCISEFCLFQILVKKVMHILACTTYDISFIAHSSAIKHINVYEAIHRTMHIN